MFDTICKLPGKYGADYWKPKVKDMSDALNRPPFKEAILFPLSLLVFHHTNSIQTAHIMAYPMRQRERGPWNSGPNSPYTGNGMPPAQNGQGRPGK